MPHMGHRKGTPADGYPEITRLKVSVAWDRWVLDAINRRVVKNHTSFAKEVRRLVDIGLEQDHIHNRNPSKSWREHNARARSLGVS